ncbi:MAG: hypothetical protein ACO3JL_11595 [Myxococcota bacterium]
MTRIPGGGVSRSPFGPSWSTGRATRGDGKSVGAQVQRRLFGQRKPPVIESDDPAVRTLLARLHVYRKKLARIAGDLDEDYDLTLATGTIAMIDEDGLIYVGREFLLAHERELDLQVGVLAHEVGHRPKRWQAYRDQQPLGRAELDKLCRVEETRADYFAGRALAELGLQVEPLIAFLEAISVHPHPQYFSAAIRGDAIREGYEDGKRQSNNRRRFFPELARMTDARRDLGEG